MVSMEAAQAFLQHWVQLPSISLTEERQPRLLVSRLSDGTPSHNGGRGSGGPHLSRKSSRALRMQPRPSLAGAHVFPVSTCGCSAKAARLHVSSHAQP